MAMRETERSARLYFLIGGGLGMLYGLQSLIRLANAPRRELAHEPVAAAWYLIVVSLVVSALFVLAGIDLPRALRTGARWIRGMLIMSGTALLASIVVIYLSSDADDPDRANAAVVEGMVGIAVPIAIIAYLYVNIWRLSTEAQFASSKIAKS